MMLFGCSQVKEDHIGEWEIIDEGNNIPTTITFDDLGNYILKIGGREAKASAGQVITMQYKIDYHTLPVELDIITDKKNGTGPKAIMRFIEKDTMQLQIGNGINDSRPLRFDNDESMATYIRIES
jgi:hypothetical protein